MLRFEGDDECPQSSVSLERQSIWVDCGHLLCSGAPQLPCPVLNFEGGGSWPTSAIPSPSFPLPPQGLLSTPEITFYSIGLGSYHHKAGMDMLINLILSLIECTHLTHCTHVIYNQFAYHKRNCERGALTGGKNTCCENVSA